MAFILINVCFVRWGGGGDMLAQINVTRSTNVLENIYFVIPMMRDSQITHDLRFKQTHTAGAITNRVNFHTNTIPARHLIYLP